VLLGGAILLQDRLPRLFGGRTLSLL